MECCCNEDLIICNDYHLFIHFLYIVILWMHIYIYVCMHVCMYLSIYHICMYLLSISHLSISFCHCLWCVLCGICSMWQAQSVILTIAPVLCHWLSTAGTITHSPWLCQFSSHNNRILNLEWLSHSVSVLSCHIHFFSTVYLRWNCAGVYNSFLCTVE